jgi:hypothetical protein
MSAPPPVQVVHVLDFVLGSVGALVELVDVVFSVPRLFLCAQDILIIT